VTKIKDLPKFKRPREKLFEKGPTALRNHELLAILLRTGYQGKSAIEIAKKILKMTSLNQFAKLSLPEMSKIKGVGKSRAAIIAAAFSLSQRLSPKKEDTISSPKDVFKLVIDYKNKKKEYLIGIYLDARRQLIAKKVISIGTLDTSLIHPREVFNPAVRYNAALIIVVHNHPSGDSAPSLEDKKITQKLIMAGEILGIGLIDHLIITKDDYFSFKDHGLIA
jgi:DNA repair protein RadC